MEDNYRHATLVMVFERINEMAKRLMKPFLGFILSLIYLLLVVALIALGRSSGDADAAPDLIFNPQISGNPFRIDIFDEEYWGLRGGTVNQNKTLYMYQQWLKEQGLRDPELLRRASAILVHENEKLTHDRSGDNHLSYGICMRYVKKHYKKFWEEHPDQATLQGQIEWCGQRFLHSLKEFSGLHGDRHVWMPDGRTIKTNERFFRIWIYHNCPACAYRGENTTHLKPPYFQRVRYSYEKLELL